MGRGAPPRAKPAHPSSCLHLSAQQMGHVMPTASTCQHFPEEEDPGPTARRSQHMGTTGEQKTNSPSPTHVEKI